MKKILILIVSILLILGIVGFASKKIKKEYTVSFSTDSISVISQQKVKKGNIIGEPAEPVKEGYDFLYWESNGVKYDFTEKVEENVDLKAIWKKQDVYSISAEMITEEESKLKVYKNGTDVSKDIEELYDANKQNIAVIDSNHDSIIIKEENLDKIEEIKENGKIIKLEPKSDCPADMICIDPKEKDYYGKEATE